LDYFYIKGNAFIHWFVDTAYTKNYQNDPTGIIGACKIGNDLYIVGARKLFLEFPELIKYLPTYVKSQGYTQGSTIRIEPKANGLSVIQQMRAETQLNIASIPSPSESKETRLIVASTTVESGRVVIVEGQWNDEFITEVCSFPAAPHDEYPDLLGYAINYFYGKIQICPKLLNTLLKSYLYL
jgi:predicted phage terminase large subunit-like protein